jgi:hypothetical protein
VPEDGPADTGRLVVYVDHSDVDRSRLAQLHELIRQLVDVIEAREPRLLAYGFHLDEEHGRMTVTAVHPDSASLELHLEVGRELFRGFGELLTLREIEVYGPVSERARSMLERKAVMLGGARVTVAERHHGFSRVTR